MLPWGPQSPMSSIHPSAPPHDYHPSDESSHTATEQRAHLHLGLTSPDGTLALSGQHFGLGRNKLPHQTALHIGEAALWHLGWHGTAQQAQPPTTTQIDHDLATGSEDESLPSTLQCPERTRPTTANPTHTDDADDHHRYRQPWYEDHN